MPQVWRIKLLETSPDIVAEGYATTFNDHTTCSTIPADRAGIVACSLPRGKCAATKGTPFAGVPDLALVRIYYPLTGRTVYCPVIDEGPAWIAEAGTGKPGSAMIDLTPAAAKALGMKDNAVVIIRVLAGSEVVFKGARAGMYEKA